MKKIIRSPEIDFGLPDEPVNEKSIPEPIDEKPVVVKPEWKIDADLPEALMAEGLNLLSKGTSISIVSTFCGISSDKIKKMG